MPWKVMVRVRNVLIMAMPCGRNATATIPANGNIGVRGAIAIIAAMVACIFLWEIIVTPAISQDKNYRLVYQPMIGYTGVLSSVLRVKKCVVNILGPVTKSVA